MDKQTATRPPYADHLTPGSMLDNGAVVVASKLYEARETVGDYVVLAIKHGEYVTWHVAAYAETGATEAFWGHYFAADFTRACADFDARQ